MGKKRDRNRATGKNAIPKSQSAPNPKATEPPQPLTQHPFVVGYLKKLDEELRDASPSQIAEMRARVVAEFERRLAHVPEPTDEQVLAVSMALGRPREVAIAAGLISEDAGPNRSDQMLSRAPILLGIAGIFFTFYSSIIAIVLGVGALVVLIGAIPRWERLKNTIVVGGILVAAIAIILAVQLLGASQI